MRLHFSEHQPPGSGRVRGEDIKHQESGDDPLWGGVCGELAQETEISRAVGRELRVDRGVVEDLVGMAEDEGSHWTQAVGLKDGE